MKPIIAVLSFVGNMNMALAGPLEDMATAQVSAQAPGSKMIAPFFEGAGEKTDWTILLDAGNCYWFSGAAMGNVQKLALYLWGPTGFFRLTDAKSTSGRAVMAHCAKESGLYKFQAKIEGTGSYVVGVFAKTAPKQVPIEVEEKAGPNLGPLCDKHARQAAPGAKRAGDFFEGQGNSYGHDDRFDNSIQMVGGKCYWIIACGEPDHIKRLSLYLWGPDNKRITEAKSDDANPMIGHCAAYTGMYKFQTKITGGSGSFKAGVYVK